MQGEADLNGDGKIDVVELYQYVRPQGRETFAETLQ
jgi:Ca2+-binding EF-hand superfamily protein